jgi:hypothetical protein
LTRLLERDRFDVSCPAAKGIVLSEIAPRQFVVKNDLTGDFAGL